MAPLVVLLVVAVVATMWIRSVKAKRQRWLRELNLPGTWDLQNGTSPVVLELRGRLSQGRYVARAGSTAEEGDWRLLGHTLTLTPDGSDRVDYDLRMFDAGTIGIDGPGRQQQVYVKRRDNVVSLRQRS